MTSEHLIKQIEIYSNAIVAFAVLQALAYSYAFGTNTLFNCLVKTASYLAEGLILLFVFATGLAIFATVSLSQTIQQLSGEYRGVMKRLYIGKLVTIILFSLVPIILTIGYGVRDYPNKMKCKTTGTLSLLKAKD